jgi:multiple antibiotic resistance protein
VVPLAVPMIAGPSAVAAVLLLISRAPEQLLTWLAALSCAWMLTALVPIASGRLYERIGDRVVLKSCCFDIKMIWVRQMVDSHNRARLY